MGEIIHFENWKESSAERGLSERNLKPRRRHQGSQLERLRTGESSVKRDAEARERARTHMQEASNLLKLLGEVENRVSWILDDCIEYVMNEDDDHGPFIG